MAFWESVLLHVSEDGNRAGFRKVMLLYKFNDVRSPKKEDYINI